MKSIWVINQKGGTGKTSIASVLADHFISTGSGYAIIDADCQPDSKASERSSLSAIFTSAERIEISASPAALVAKPTLSVSHWDQLFDRACSTCMLCDFGANVASSLLFWIQESDIGERLEPAGIQLDIIVVTTAHPDSVSDALSIVKELRQLIPESIRRFFLVMNHSAGGFEAYASSPELVYFADLVEASELAMIIVPRCGSEIWRDTERARITPLAAAAMTSAELSARLGTPTLETARGRKALARWHAAVVQAFQDAGLVEHGEPQ